MQSQQIVFALITFSHDLFTVIWIGGLLALGAIVLPTLLRMHGRGPETRRVMDAIQRRLSRWVYVSIVGLVVTGILLGRRNPAFGGLFSMANSYSVALSLKHLLVLLMIVVALLRSWALDRIRALQPQSREKLKGALLYLNMALGILVLLLSGISAALGSAKPPLG